MNSSICFQHFGDIVYMLSVIYKDHVNVFILALVK